MATVTTTITPEVNVLPLAGYAEPAANRSYWARGLVFAKSRDETIAASGVGDNQNVNVTLSLPVNFAYVLLDHNVGLVRNTAGATNNFNNDAALSMFNAVASGDRTIDIPLGSYANGEAVASALGVKNYKAWSTWSFPIQAVSGSQVTLIWENYNETANDGAYKADVAITLLQYDIEQINHVGVNSPVPVR